MVNIDSYLRIFRWRGLSGELLLRGTPDPRETAIAMIQLAALARRSPHFSEVLPRPLLSVLTDKVNDKGMLSGEMNEPVARALFLSDLHDFLQLYRHRRIG